ncbi:hypothetical protein EON65_45195 [archaeon]|nr:MAG: hypothetical protein EON65_45195 [archaeon]
MGYNDPRQQAVRIVSLSFGLASFVCSSLTLLLIYMMRVQNGYLLILLTMTLAQLMYDVNYILRVDSHNDDACYVSQFLDLVGGLSVSFWVNILSYSVTYTIVRCQSVEVFKHYWLFSLFGTVLPFCIGIIAVSTPQVLDVSDDDGSGCGFQDTTQANFVVNFYYWGRFISVLLTTILCVYNFIKLRDITSSGDNIGYNAQHNIKVVAKVHDYNNMYRTIYRMNFYAVAQIACRSGAAWNEWDNGRYSSFASEIAAAVCSPSLGICNFIIFVVSLII